MSFKFDATNVAPQTAFEPVPTGWYALVMTASEVKENNKKNGKILEVEYTIQSPETYKGRKVFDRFNIENPNQQAVEIAYAQLSAVCHAINVIKFDNPSQLHNKILEARVSLRPAGPGADGQHYEASNEIKGYRAFGTGQQQSAATVPAATQPATAFVPPAVEEQAPPPVVEETPPPVVEEAPPVIVDWKELASNDGWKPHPQSAGWWYKGKEVKKEADVEAMFAAPSAPADWTAAPTNQAQAAPAQVATPTTEIPEAGETPPWLKK